MPSKQSTNSNSASSSNFDTTTVPGWAPQVNALDFAFNNAFDAFNTAHAVPIPQNFVAQMTPDQLAAFNSMASSAQGFMPQADNLVNSGSGMVTQGSRGAVDALNGLNAFNPSATNNMGLNIAGGNAFAAGANIPAAVRNAMLTAMQTARDVTLPGITSGAAGTGNINSNRPDLAAGMVERGLAQQATDLGATMFNNLYEHGADLTGQTNTANNVQRLGALAGALQGGTGLANAGANVFDTGTSGVKNLYNMITTGLAGPQQSQQLALDNALKSYDANVNGPFQPLNNFYNIIGSTNWGQHSFGNAQQNSNSSSTTYSTPSVLDTIGKIIGAGGSLLGSKGTMFSGGSGLLGMSPSLFGLLA